MNNRFRLLILVTSSVLVSFLLLGAVMGRSASRQDPYPHFAVYTEVLSRIKSEYVEEPDMKNITLGALNGLLEAIDPYASYLNADQYKQYLRSKDNNGAGVGLVLSRRYGYVGIVDAVPGSPAAKAGLATGDLVESINGIATRDMPLAYADMLLRGEPGGTVKLAVMRVRRGTEPQEIDLIRQSVAYPPVNARILQSDIGYVQVQSMETGKSEQIKAKLVELQAAGAKRFILDLRRSAAGTPEEGIALADLFLDKGLISFLIGQKVPRKDFQATPANTVTNLPLVVITNRGTANGAEIAAASLLEAGRAQVVGERTYGDAALRRAVNLDDGGAIVLSVAKYHSPEGKAIQDTGVTPSVPVVEVEPYIDVEEEETTEAPIPPQPPRTPAEDVLLNKAIEVLTQGATKLAADKPTQSPGLQLPKSGIDAPLTPLNRPRPNP